MQLGKMYLLVLCVVLVTVAAGPPVIQTREDIEEYKNFLERTIEGSLTF